jgi:hypothetical protein
MFFPLFLRVPRVIFLRLTLKRWQRELLARFMVEAGADLVDVSAVDADEFVKLSAGDAELFGPVGDVGGHLGVDLFGVVGAFLGLGVLGVCGAEFGLLDFFVLMLAERIGMRHGFVPLSWFQVSGSRG